MSEAPNGAASRFATLFDQFLTNCKACWPKDVELTKSSLALRTVILGNASMEERFMERFRLAIESQTSPGVRVPYRNAYEELAGKPLTTYVIAAYEDFGSLFAACDDCGIEHVTVKFKDKYDGADKGTKKVMHTVIKKLVQIAYEDAEKPEFPTREELEAHIEVRKAERKARKTVGSVNAVEAEMQMVITAIDSLKPVVGDEAVTPYMQMAPAERQAATAAWAQVSSADAGAAIKAKSFTMLLAACNIDFLNTLDLSGRDGSGKEFDEFWTCLKRVGGFGAVRSSLPTNVMSSIEREAQSVINKLQSGEVSLEALDIETIGEAVLANCSAEDMSNMAASLPQMLPQLAQLTNDMGGGMSMPGMP